jgi:excisionase family DNA binding protein
MYAYAETYRQDFEGDCDLDERTDHKAALSAERQTYSVEEAGAMLGISRNRAYEAARNGEIPALRIGKKRLVIPKKAFDRFIAGEVAA